MDESTPPAGTGDGEASKSESGTQHPSEFCTNCGAPAGGGRYCSNCGSAARTQDRGVDIEVGTVRPDGRLTVTRKGVVTVTVIVLVVVGIAGAAWALLSQATERTYTIKGNMTLFDLDDFRGYKAGDSCSGSGGYRDIREGATVTVKDEAGTLVGSGSLGPGRISDESLRLCVFPIEVKGVKDANFFQVEVSHRGGLSYSKADMERNDWTIHSSLGI